MTESANSEQLLKFIEVHNLTKEELMDEEYLSDILHNFNDHSNVKINVDHIDHYVKHIQSKLVGK